jgi:hypothetical protein
VHNPSHISHGVSRVELDGREIQGNLVRFTAEGNEHQVDVWMGS